MGHKCQQWNKHLVPPSCAISLGMKCPPIQILPSAASFLPPRTTTTCSSITLLYLAATDCGIFCHRCSAQSSDDSSFYWYSFPELLGQFKSYVPSMLSTDTSQPSVSQDSKPLWCWAQKTLLSTFLALLLRLTCVSLKCGNKTARLLL